MGKCANCLQVITSIRIKPEKYENEYGLELTFYDNAEEVGKACTADFCGKQNSFLHGLEVSRRYRNKGYGSAILSYMVEIFDVDTLYVARENQQAIHLYKKFGFEITGNFDERNVVMKRQRMVTDNA